MPKISRVPTLCLITFISIFTAENTWSDGGNHGGGQPAATTHSKRTAKADRNLEPPKQAPSFTKNRINPIEANKASITLGYELYSPRCSHCHGRRGLTQLNSGAPINLVIATKQRTSGEIAWKIAEGDPLKHGWGALLTAEEIWHIVNYIQSFKQ